MLRNQFWDKLYKTVFDPSIDLFENNCPYMSKYLALLIKAEPIYEGDPRSNANPSVISFTFGNSKNGLHVYNDILSILRDFITFSINHMATPVA